MHWLRSYDEYWEGSSPSGWNSVVGFGVGAVAFIGTVVWSWLTGMPGPVAFVLALAAVALVLIGIYYARELFPAPELSPAICVLLGLTLLSSMRRQPAFPAAAPTG